MDAPALARDDRTWGAASWAGTAARFVGVVEPAQFAGVIFPTYVAALPPKGFQWGLDTRYFDAEFVAPPDSEAPPAESAPHEAGAPPLRAESEGLDIDALIIKERLGEGTQSEVLLAELPGRDEPVAVKVGLRLGAVAREAAVLSALPGAPGFPAVLHHEAEGPRAPGGFLVMELLGPSLDDLWQSRRPVAAPTLLRVGRGALRRLRQLHLAGFVHNDVKPANMLLGAGSTLQPTVLHLIDFGSCTRAEGHAASEGEPAPLDGPLGTPLFASVAAEDCTRPMRPVDDVEGLAYALAYMAAGSLPWKDAPDARATAMKRALHTPSGADGLTGQLDSATAVAALQALWAEVRRCHDEGPTGRVDYEACLAALGGGSLEEAAEHDTLSELAFVNSLRRAPSSEERFVAEANGFIRKSARKAGAREGPEDAEAADALRSLRELDAV